MNENFLNFASGTLNASITSGAASLVLGSGQGSLFPSTNFLVTVDNEVMFVTSRSSDTLSGLLRGFDNTNAAAHTAGATVQNSVCAYNLSHLWSDVADNYRPEVPPVQVNGATRSSYDNEFETQGSWVLSPSPVGQTLFNVNTSQKSSLILNRASGDLTTYYAYIPATAVGTGAIILNCRISDGIDMTTGGSSDQATIDFFAADSNPPTSGLNSGIRFKMTVSSSYTASGGVVQPTARTVQQVTSYSGSVGTTSNAVPIAIGQPIYLRMACDGFGNWLSYLGDGITYWILGKKYYPVTIASVGFAFSITNPSLKFFGHTAAIDYFRGDTLSGTNPRAFGSWQM